MSDLRRHGLQGPVPGGDIAHVTRLENMALARPGDSCRGCELCREKVALEKGAAALNLLREIRNEFDENGPVGLDRFMSRVRDLT